MSSQESSLPHYSDAELVTDDEQLLSQPQSQRSEAEEEEAATSVFNATSELDLEKIQPNENPYAAKFGRGHDVLLRAVWRKTNERFPVFAGVKWPHFYLEGVSIMASTDGDVLTQVIGGNLMKLYETDSGFQRRIDVLQRADPKHPCIYGQWLVKTNGDAMSPAELKTMALKMRKYLDDDAYAGQVDEAFEKRRTPSIVGRGRPRKGWKASMTTGSTRRVAGNIQSKPNQYELSKTRQDKIRTFVAAVLARVDSVGETDAEFSEPTTIPLCEYGYAVDGVERLRQHRKFVGSNYILDLARAIIEHELNSAGIVLRQKIIYLIWDPAHAFAGEALFTEFGLGYIWEGYGFSHWGAGTNNASADQPSVVNYRAWKKQLAQGPFFDNIAAMVKKFKARYAMILRIEELKKIRAEQEFKSESSSSKGWLSFVTTWIPSRILMLS